jgi:hypothetical protein
VTICHERFNPTLDSSVIERARASDLEAARAEWMPSSVPNGAVVAIPVLSVLHHRNARI